MKTLSLKLDDDIFKETETIVGKLKRARNRYINDALKLYNKYNRRSLLKKKLHEESKLVRDNSMRILKEFEKLDEYSTI